MRVAALGDEVGGGEGVPVSRGEEGGEDISAAGLVAVLQLSFSFPDPQIPVVVDDLRLGTAENEIITVSKVSLHTLTWGWWTLESWLALWRWCVRRLLLKELVTGPGMRLVLSMVLWCCRMLFAKLMWGWWSLCITARWRALVEPLRRGRALSLTPGKWVWLIESLRRALSFTPRWVWFIESLWRSLSFTPRWVWFIESLRRALSFIPRWV